MELAGVRVGGRRMKIVGLLLGLGVVAVGAGGPGLLGAAPAEAASVFVDEGPGPVEHHPDWMSRLPDTTLLNDISLPGTHDSGVLEDGPSVETQAMSISSQLISGIRSFDIRLKCDNDGDNSDHENDVLQLFHGDFYQSIDLEDVLDDFKSFLVAHGTEALLVRIAENDGPNTGHDCERIFEEVFKSDYYQNPRWNSLFWVDTPYFPELVAIRGRIVLAPDTFDESYRDMGWPWGNGGYWDHEDKYKVCTVPVLGCEATMGEKAEGIQENIREANARPRNDDSKTNSIGMTYTSGSTFLNPDDVAEGVAGEEGQNQRLYDFLRANQFREVGVVAMDFPGGDLITAIIHHNELKLAYDGPTEATFYTGLRNMMVGRVLGRTATITKQSGLPQGLTAITRNNELGVYHLLVIGGTPEPGSEGTHSVQLTICDDVGTCDEVAITLTVETGMSPTVQIEDTTVYFGVQASIPITTTGRPKPTVKVSWIDTGGVAPLELVKNASGGYALEGIPDEFDVKGDNFFGTFNGELLATNGVGSEAREDFTLTMLPPEAPSFENFGSLAPLATGRDNTYEVRATGGPPPTLRVLGTLPEGIIFTDVGDGIGRFTGTPPTSAAGTYDVQVIAENIAGERSAQLRLKVAHPPEITVAYTTADGQTFSGGGSSWTNQDVTVRATCTAGSGSVGTFRLTADGLSGPTGGDTSTIETVVSTDGRNQLPLTCGNTEGLVTDLDDEVVAIDKTAPVVVARAHRAPDSNGWYNAPLDIDWQEDGPTPPNQSDIVSCTATTYRGPDGAEITLTGNCTDLAGNTGSADFSVRYDSTPPEVKVAPVSTPDGLAGWWRTAPTLGTTGEDFPSGIATCSPDAAYVGPDGNALVATGSCTDEAGNHATGTSGEFRVDREGPLVEVLLDGGPDGNDSWYRTPPAFTATGVDAISGPVGCSRQGTYAGPDGTDLAASHSCTDAAGNPGQGTSAKFKLDRAAPDVRVRLLSEPDGLGGWFVTAPLLGASGTDVLSGIDTCDPVTPYDGPDGAGVSATRECVDVAGNVGTGRSPVFPLDRVAPDVAVVPTSPPDGTNGWYISAPSFLAQVKDATSGAAPCPDAVRYEGDDGRNLTVSRMCADVAGNTTVGTSAGFDLDRGAPMVTCPATPTFLLRSPESVLEATVADDLSGPVAHLVGGDVPVDAAGSFTAARVGVDNAGNRTTMDCSYLVTHGIELRYDSDRTVQPGATVPIKVQLVDAAGNVIFDPDLVVTVTGITPAPGGHVPTGDRFTSITMRGGAYQYDLRTKGYESGSYALLFEVDGDPVEHAAAFLLR